MGATQPLRACGYSQDTTALNVAYLWADLAGHLTGIWRSISESVTRLKGGPIPAAEAGLPDVNSAIARWRDTDRFYAALGDLNQILRDDPDAL